MVVGIRPTKRLETITCGLRTVVIASLKVGIVALETTLTRFQSCWRRWTSSIQARHVRSTFACKGFTPLSGVRNKNLPKCQAEGTRIVLMEVIPTGHKIRQSRLSIFHFLAGTPNITLDCGFAYNIVGVIPGRQSRRTRLGNVSW